MVLVKIRGFCTFLALRALDLVHLAAREVQTSAPASPKHRAPTGRKGEGPEEGDRGGEGNRATSPTTPPPRSPPSGWQEQSE